MTFACPCCGHKTFGQKPDNTFEICSVCFWEDDGVQLDNPDLDGCANTVSLRQGQKNFEKFGASELCFVTKVRPPNKDEARDKDWKPLD